LKAPNATKPPNVPPAVAVAGVLFTIYLLNYGFVQMGWAPWAYCLGLKIAPVFAGWYQFAVVAVIGYFAYSVIRNGIVGALWAALLVMLVMGFPVYLTTLFGLGAEARCAG